MNNYPKLLDHLFCESCGYGKEDTVSPCCTLEQRLSNLTYDGRYAASKKVFDRMTEDEIAYAADFADALRSFLKQTFSELGQDYKQSEGFEGSQLEAALIDAADFDGKTQNNKIHPRCLTEFLLILDQLLNEHIQEKENS